MGLPSAHLKDSGSGFTLPGQNSYLVCVINICRNDNGGERGHVFLISNITARI